MSLLRSFALYGMALSSAQPICENLRELMRYD
jgi:hypothetical protein